MSGRSRKQLELPRQIEPMLAQMGEPFDSPNHLFEIKWDGIRCITLVGQDSFSMQSRQKMELRERYPELGCLADLPPGTVLDGELVVLDDGRPAFNKILRRNQQSARRSIAQLSELIPATYMVFDILYHGGERVMSRPLSERRKLLLDVVGELNAGQVLVSEAYPEHGIQLFEKIKELELEGIMAKRLDSSYVPGKRSSSWKKIKVAQTREFDVIGFTPSGAGVLGALIVGEQCDGKWVYKGRVGTGFTDIARRELHEELSSAQSMPTEQRPTGGPKQAVWCDSGMKAKVKYLEETESGKLRFAVFQGRV